MSLLPLALVASLLGTEPEPLEPVFELEEVEEDPDAPPPVVGKRIGHRTIDSLVELDQLSITLEVTAVDGEPGTVDAIFSVSTAAQHEFDGTVGELELGIAVLGEDDQAFVWERLHTPPLQLTPAQIERTLPSALALVTLADEGDPFGNDDSRKLSLVDRHDGLQLPQTAPTALVVVTAYTLGAASERDVIRILEHGGPADLGALAGWASGLAVDGVEPFDAEARRRIIEVVATRLRGLRAPPAFGDFQRINALTAVASACAGPEDLELLLFLQRPVSILLSGAIVSYDHAVSEENLLGLQVHGFRRLQSRSDASLQWEAAMERMRVVAVDKLLRLAFDPLDFRGAPSTMRRHPSLHVAANELLAPIDTTDVPHALALVNERPELQRSVLEFYVEAGHTPVVEPLIDWLTVHPEHVETLGSAAMVRMGEAMLPVLLRRFGDFEAPSSERAVMWRLMGALPERHAPALAAVFGSIGVELPSKDPGMTPSVAELLHAVRLADELAQQRRVAELTDRVRKGDDDRVSLRARVQAAKSIADLAPERLSLIADEVIAVHVAAARDLATDGPSGARGVIAQLRALPLPGRVDEVARVAVLIEAEMLEAQGERAAALTAMEEHDPWLADPELRARYIAIIEYQYREQVAASAWDACSLLLDRAEALGLDELDVGRRRAAIFAIKRRPFIALGVAVALVVLMTLVVLVHRSGVLARLRQRPIVEEEPEPVEGAIDETNSEDLAEAWAQRDDDKRAAKGDHAA